MDLPAMDQPFSTENLRFPIQFFGLGNVGSGPIADCKLKNMVESGSNFHSLSAT